MKRNIALILFFLVVAVGFILSPNIGSAWDEPDNIFSAGVYVNFFTHGFNSSYFRILTDKASVYGDRIIPNDHLLSHYPPFPNYVGVLFVSAAHALHIQTTAQAIIIAWHLATVLFFALTVVMTYRFGLLLGLSEKSSLFAALAVFFYPQLFGHGFSNLKDAAQVAMMVTSLYFLVKNNLFVGGVIFGLGLATKFNAVYVPIIWGLWYLMTSKKHIKFTIYYVLFTCFVGFTSVFIVWPYLWFHPIQHVMEVIRYFTTVGQGYRVIWDGTWYFVGVGKILWWYPLVSLVYTTPIPLLALIFFGMIILVRTIFRKRVLLLLPIWILVPLIRTFSPWSAFYDLMRHFLEIIPAIMLTAAIGLEWFFQKKQHLRATGIMLMVIILGQMIYINASLFPYSTGYYNMLARSPNTNFDRDIEALSVKEAMEYIHQTYGTVSVFFQIGGHLSWLYLTPEDQYVFPQQGKAEIVVVINKASHLRISEFAAQNLSGYIMVHEIRRGPAIFAWIYKKN